MEQYWVSRSLTDVPKFEKQNNIGINIFGFDSNKILPLYLCGKNKHKAIPLLLLTDGFTCHYSLITNLKNITDTSFANGGFTDFETTYQWKNVWIYVGSKKLFILLCQRMTRKFNLQFGKKRFQFLYLFTPTQRPSALSMTPAAKILIIATP